MEMQIILIILGTLVVGVAGGFFLAWAMHPDGQSFRAMRAELERARELLAIALENR